MKKILLLGACFSLIVIMTGCSLLHRFGRLPAAQINNAAVALPFPFYSGLKANIVVMDFEIKAAKATKEVGAGLHEMLTTALMQSSRFLIVERQPVSILAQEQAGPSISDVDKTQGDIQKEKAKGADLIVAVAVAEFEPQVSGGSSGVGGGGGASRGMMGGLLGEALNKAHVVLDIRILDVPSSEVIATTRVQGQASDVTGGLTKEFSGALGLSKELSNYADTPMGKAIRICIIEAVRYVSEAIPGDYYKY